MERNKFNKLLSRYLKGAANETEKDLVDAWYKSYRSEEEHIQIEKLAKEAAKQKFKKEIKKRTRLEKPKQLLYTTWIRIAASILLVSSAGLLFHIFSKSNFPEKARYTVIQTDIGTIKKITLPDSSEVWLNMASRISIPEKFQGKTREVFLEDGEAFFQVKKNPKRPFIVHTSDLNIKVLGTSFNVRSYKKIEDQKIFVKTGKVSVSRGEKLLGVLSQGDQISYNTSTTISELSHSNSEHFADWKNGSTYLEQISFKELAIVLQNTYGLNLKAGSKKVSSYQFTFLLSTAQPIEQTLSMISMIHNTHYRKEANDIIIY